MEFSEHECRGHPRREEAVALLLARFAYKAKLAAHNTSLVNRPFGLTAGEPWCHRASRPFGKPHLPAYRVIVGTYGGECVSAACFRHVPPRARVRLRLRYGQTRRIRLLLQEFAPLGG